MKTRDAVNFIKEYPKTKTIIERIQREQGDSEHEKVSRADMCRLFCIANANDDRVELVELSKCQQIFFQLLQEQMESDAEVIQHHFSSLDESRVDCKSLSVIVKQISALETKVDKLSRQEPASAAPAMPPQHQHQP